MMHARNNSRTAQDSYNGTPGQLPNPALIEKQKAAFGLSLEEQAQQGKEMLTAQQKQQTDYIYQAAEVQKMQLISQIDEQAKQQELMLNQKYSKHIMSLEQQYLHQKLLLEKQANDLSMEYQMRKSQEERMKAQYEEDLRRQQPQWVCSPEFTAPINIRANPDVNGRRTEEELQPGEIFNVSEELRGDDGVLYLRLADGRGWVFDKKPGVGIMCVRNTGQVGMMGTGPLGSCSMPPPLPPPLPTHVPPHMHPCNPYIPPSAAQVPMPPPMVQPGPPIPPPGPVTVWLHNPDYLAPLAIRTVPDIDGPRTGQMLMPGDVFRVCEEREGPCGILYLRLADGRGWAFNRKPGVGNMCKRQSSPTQAALMSGMLNGRGATPPSRIPPTGSCMV